MRDTGIATGWVLAAGGMLLAGCLLAGGACREVNEFQPPPPPKVTVAKPLVETVVTYNELPGQTQAIESVQVRARVEGFLLTVEFEEGSMVEAGDLLYTIEPESYAAHVKAAEARLATARATMEKAEFDHGRMVRLQADEAASEVEVIEAKTDHDKAAADVMLAEAALEMAALNLTYTRITAPIAGHVNRTEVNVGNLVGRGEQTLLTTIVPWDPIHVYVTVGERDVLQWRRRQAAGNERENVPVFLRLADGTNYATEGRVDYIDNQVDVQTGTLRARAVFDNTEQLILPGIFVRVLVPREPVESVLIPESALQRDMTGFYVFTVDGERQVARVNVVTGPDLGTMRTVTSGLTGEESVIITGVQRVQVGLVVDPEVTTLPPVAELAGAGAGGPAGGDD